MLVLNKDLHKFEDKERISFKESIVGFLTNKKKKIEQLEDELTITRLKLSDTKRRYDAQKKANERLKNKIKKLEEKK